MKSKFVEQQEFNLAMGGLDESISRLLLLSTLDIGEVNEQTLRHHADDMIEAANKILTHLDLKKRVATADTSIITAPGGTIGAGGPFAAKKVSNS